MSKIKTNTSFYQAVQISILIWHADQGFGFEKLPITAKLIVWNRMSTTKIKIPKRGSELVPFEKESGAQPLVPKSFHNHHFCIFQGNEAKTWSRFFLNFL